MSNTHKLENGLVYCPVCGQHLNGASGITTEALPKKGDLGICFNCTAILEYEEGFFVHEFSETQMAALKLIEIETYNALLFAKQQILEYKANRQSLLN